jgi:hypothetical protein
VKRHQLAIAFVPGGDKLILDKSGTAGKRMRDRGK